METVRRKQKAPCTCNRFGRIKITSNKNWKKTFTGPWKRLYGFNNQCVLDHFMPPKVENSTFWDIFSRKMSVVPVRSTWFHGEWRDGRQIQFTPSPHQHLQDLGCWDYGCRESQSLWLSQAGARSRVNPKYRQMDHLEERLSVPLIWNEVVWSHKPEKKKMCRSFIRWRTANSTNHLAHFDARYSNPSALYSSAKTPRF